MYSVANNAWSKLSQGITADATSLTVEDASSFPEPPFVVSIDDEIIEVWSKTTNTLSSLVRGVEGTTPAAHSSGVRVENRFTAGTYQKAVQAFADLSAEQVAYDSIVEGFDPTTAAAAIDSLAGVRIVEMGENANGEYVRWENGLQVCFYRLPWLKDLTPTARDGSYFYDVPWQYPASFVVAPSVNATASTVVDTALRPTNITYVGTVMTGTDITIRIWSTAQFDGISSSGFFAIGRWR